MPNLGFALLERAWSLRGFDQFLIDLVSEPAWAEQLLERIVEIQVRLAHRFVALGVDGGVPTQDVLPHGTPDQVRAATRASARTLAPDGTGLLLDPSHRMQSDIPPENVMALLEAHAVMLAAPGVLGARRKGLQAPHSTELGVPRPRPPKPIE